MDENELKENHTNASKLCSRGFSFTYPFLSTLYFVHSSFVHHVQEQILQSNSSRLHSMLVIKKILKP